MSISSTKAGIHVSKVWLAVLSEFKNYKPFVSHMDQERSLEMITTDDLRALLSLSTRGLTRYFTLKNTKYLSIYNFDEPYAVALCQGAAKHYVDGKNGVKDFDVWFFFQREVVRLPHRKIIEVNFANEKFGNKRVDILFRDIRIEKDLDTRENLGRYLASGTKSAYFLSQKPMVVLYPPAHFGLIIDRGNSIPAC